MNGKQVRLTHEQAELVETITRSDYGRVTSILDDHTSGLEVLTADELSYYTERQAMLADITWALRNSQDVVDGQTGAKGRK